jgi:uncharacterized damage-inducible protein DinB
MSTQPATTSDLSYPIGKFHYAGPMSSQQRDAAILAISEAPVKVRAALHGLSPRQLDKPYRPGGWTVRQVAHHVPDSHLNAYVRTKLALTEQEPTIRPYNEKAWAELSDTKLTPIETSLTLLEAIHQRWDSLLCSLADADFARTFRHPEHGVRTLDWMIALYAWHGVHHTAHITALRERMGWK